MNARTLSLVFSVLFGVSCAGQAELVRPDQESIGVSLGDSSQCTPELLKAPNGAQRFIVEWNDGDRESLENEMADGVALVKYTCDGIQLLRSCSVPGEYGYRAGSRKTKTLQITDAASASVNLSSPVPGAAFKAAMDQGRALNLGYVMIGSMTTPVKDVTLDQLDRAACKEATHFVYQTQVGAFAIEAGERGKATTAVDILGYGKAHQEVSSERHSLSADGDAKNCERATSKDNEPPEGCSAMMRISIIPLVNGKIEAVRIDSDRNDKKASASTTRVPVDTRSCPAGMVFDSELCVKQSETKSYLCERGDLAGCEKQCRNGSHESCGRMAETFFEQEDFLGYYFLSKKDDPKIFKALKGFKDLNRLMQEACDEEEGNACTFAGLLIGIWTGDDSEPDDDDQGEVMLDLFSDGCELGNSIACNFVMAALGLGHMTHVDFDSDVEEMEYVMSNGCDSGASGACMELGGFFYKGHKYARPPQPVDVKRAAKYTAKACLSGVPEACFWSAAMYASNDAASCKSLIDKVAPSNDDKVKQYDSYYWPKLGRDERASAVKSFCAQTASLYNPTRAHDLANKACFLSGGRLTENACQISKVIKR